MITSRRRLAPITKGLPMAQTERQRQQQFAITSGQPKVYEYRCSDGEWFAAVAATEAGAWCVLNAERPGTYGEVLRVRVAREDDMRILADDDDYIPPVLAPARARYVTSGSRT